jgi:hypothetical protein
VEDPFTSAISFDITFSLAEHRGFAEDPFTSAFTFGVTFGLAN